MRKIAIAITLSLAIIGATMHYFVAEQQALAAAILRLHCVANSNSYDDQMLKYQIRDKILDYVATFTTKEEIVANIPQIQSIAQAFSQSQGFDYAITASLANVDFPTKTYGEISLPAGNYQSLQIEIGAAAGQNWWCVVYPNICYVNDPPALQTVVTASEYALITGNQPLKFRIIEWLGGAP